MGPHEVVVVLEEPVQHGGPSGGGRNMVTTPEVVSSGQQVSHTGSGKSTWLHRYNIYNILYLVKKFLNLEFS